jgi:hypothetical protein
MAAKRLPPSDAERALALGLLQRAVADAGRQGKAAVATRLGCSRTLLARVLSPNDPLQITAPLTRLVIARYHVIADCPATGLPQPVSECRRLSEGKAPTHNPLAMRIWKTCQTCPHKPQGDLS